MPPVAIHRLWSDFPGLALIIPPGGGGERAHSRGGLRRAAPLGDACAARGGLAGRKPLPLRSHSDTDSIGSALDSMSPLASSRPKAPAAQLDSPLRHRWANQRRMLPHLCRPGARARRPMRELLRQRRIWMLIMKVL